MPSVRVCFVVGNGSVLQGRFRLDRQIGRGGFARVFLCTDLTLGRQVAIKVLDPELLEGAAEHDFLARFRQEARAVAALDHPNILGVYDYGEAEGAVYLVMPYVEGGTVAAQLAGGRALELARVGSYLRQAAGALDHAHRRNLVHRDIKPQNMLLRADEERLLLADFGIAKVLTAITTQVHTGAVGTLAYMAPEQFRGLVSPAIDIYALGCVLFQMLTGQVPFSGSTEELVFGHLSSPIPSLAERSDGHLPDTLQPIIERALEKRPEDRYATAGDLALAFDAALPAPPPPPGRVTTRGSFTLPSGPAPTRASPPPPPAIVGAALPAAIGDARPTADAPFGFTDEQAGTASGMAAGHQANPLASSPPLVAPPATPPRWPSPPSPAPPSRAHTVPLALPPTPVAAPVLPFAAVPAPGRSSRRAPLLIGLGVAALLLLAVGWLAWRGPWTDGPRATVVSGVSGVAQDTPTIAAIATATTSAPATATVPALLPAAPSATGPAATPATPAPTARSPLAGRTAVTFTGHTDDVRGLAWSRDGATLFSGGSDGAVRSWRADGTPGERFAGRTFAVTGLALSPDGTMLAVASDDRLVHLWRADGTPLVTLTGHTDIVVSVAWSPDGRTIASASNDRTVRLWALNGALLRVLGGHGDVVQGVAWSPDGRFLATASWDRTVKVWRSDGALSTTLNGHTDHVFAVAWSPDSRTLASGSRDGTVRLWATDGAPRTVLTGHTSFVSSVAWSPDGRTLASGAFDNTVRLWTAEGVPLATLAGHTDAVTSLAWLPDGTGLASGSWDNTARLWR